MKHTICKYSATGVVGYICCDPFAEIFSISSIVAPQSISYINCESNKYISSFDIATPLIAGSTTREICQKETGQVIARLLWNGADAYTLFYGQDQYLVFCNASQCLVRLNGVPVLAMQAISKQNDIPAFIAQKYMGYDIETQFEIYTNEQLSKEQLTILSAIPMLVFGL